MNENLTAQHEDRGNTSLPIEYASITGVPLEIVEGALRKAANCLRGGETIVVTHEELDAIRHLIPSDVVNQSYAARWVNGLIGASEPVEVHVFTDEDAANDSALWPQLVYSGDWWSTRHEQEFPGTWKLYYGDRNADDGCKIHDTKARGLEARERAVREACAILEIEGEL